MLIDLRGIVGAAYLREGSPLVVRPRDEDEISRVVSLAHTLGKRVWPQGGATRIPAPGGVDLVVDTTRLDRIEHDPNDMVASAGCGVSFQELQLKVGAKGQRLPLDPPCHERSTLGGVLSTNAFGPSRLRHGTARDWVIGTTLIRCDGKPVHSGGKVVKNVSGYDLTKIYIGARGSLGILVSANLKLTPLPRARRTLLVDGKTREEVHAIVQTLREGPHPLASAVYDGSRLSLDFEGIPESLDRQVEAARRTAGGRVASEAESGELASLVARRQASCPTRLHYPTAAYPALLAELGTGLEELSFPGAGVTFLKSAPPHLAQALSRHGGWSSPGPIPAPTRSVMARLKEALDPKQTFGALTEMA